MALLGTKSFSRVTFIAMALFALLFGYQNCGRGFVTEPGESPIVILKSSSECSFDGRVLSDGDSVTAFLSSSFPMGSKCVSEKRRCDSGALTGSFSYSTCTPGAQASCLFNNQTVNPGETVKAYQSSTSSFGEACKSQDRICQNGALSGTYEFARCSDGEAASCLFNGQTLLHGQQMAAYETPSVLGGDSCAMETRTCDNGTLSGSYGYASCTKRALSYNDLMVGTWTIPCQAENGYASYQSRFVGSEVEVIWRYWDTTCSVVQQVEYQRKKISEVVAMPDATGTTFTWRYDAVEDGLQPLDARYVTNYNNNSFCLRTDYVIGQYRQNMPATCGPTISFWRSRLEKNGNTMTLFAADTNTGSGLTPGTRPTGLDKRPAYTRILQIGNTLPNPNVSGSLRPK